MYIESNEITNQHAQPSESQAHYDVLLLDAELRQSLAVTRSLGHRELRIAALVTNNLPFVPTFSSRWCQQKIVSPARKGTQEYLEHLEQISRSTHPQVLIASSAGTISLIRRHREQLEQFSRIALPKEPALGIAMNKEHVARIARELGLDIPKGVYINSADEVNEALRVVGLPAVAKPAEPWDAQRGLGPETKFVMTPAEARLAIEAALSAGTGVLFQQFIPGPQESISFLYKHGEIFAQFAYQTKRASSLVGGVDVLHRSIAMPSDSGTQAERLIREIGLEGYCRVEFRRDYSNKPYMVDIHPYMSDGTELAMHAGVDFPYLLYQWAMGEPIDTIQTYRVGVWRRDLGGDFKATMERISQRGKPGVMPPGRAIRDFCVSFFTPAHYDLLDWKDPRPSWTTARGWFNNAFSRKKA